MKKVAIIANFLKWSLSGGATSGGGGVVLSNLINVLSKMPEVELTVICQDFESVSLENVETIHLQHEWASPDFFVQVNDILESRNFDIVLSTLVDFCGKNSLIQAHSFKYRLNNTPLLWRPFKRIFSRKKIKIQNKLFKPANNNIKFIAVSDILKKDYQNNFQIPGENIIVAHPGVNQVNENFCAFKKNESITFGIVAGRSMNKGFILLLFALFFVKLAGYNFKLNLLTKKLNLKYLINFLGLKKQVKIIDKLDMTEFYQNIDCLVLPSFSETFGLVVLEAMSFGKPCLVSSTAGAIEIIKNENGFVFNRKSFWALVTKIIEIIKFYQSDFDEYLNVSKSAFETSKQYTWENFTNKILEGLKK